MNITSQSPPPAHMEQIRLMEERIGLMKKATETLYRNTHPVDDHRARHNRSEAARFEHLPPLPPMLPRPEYSLAANLISLEDEEILFYVACESGSVEEVASFIQKTGKPTQAVLQYGLEQASFGNQPAVARYLLEHGAALHGNVFGRVRRSKTKNSSYLEDASIFDDTQNGGKDVIIPLIRVFLDFGWHPNQAWRRATSNEGKTPLPYEGCIANGPLVELLLQHGADPNIASDSRSPDGEEPPLNRHGGDVLDSAARLGDTRLFDLLLSHGADPSFAKPLHSIVSCQIMPPNLRGSSWFDHNRFAQSPFSPRRRAMAEHILASGAAGVNDVRRLLYRDILDRQLGHSYETTAFAHACAGQDWEFAEWLLEKGADPGLCGGIALLRQYWSEPWVGPTEPEVVRQLIERVKARKA